ncbi:MAG TPA: hypothetical protein DCZ63_11485 [Geobacter sp.]|nr:hypothetical protein [Geobacter sp.]
MSYDLRQFDDLLRRRLQHHAASGLPLYSDSAVVLLLGTAAHESGFGTFLRQVNGPALGIFQIEPPTFEWLRGKYEDQFPRLLGVTADQLEWDLDLSILVARLRYYVAPPPLPDPTDLEDMAAYWFEHYNCSGVEARRQQFMLDWKRYGLPWETHIDV